MSKSESILKLFDSDVQISGDVPEILNSLSRYGIRNLAYGGDCGCNPGYIFRGEADYERPLLSTLERSIANGSKISDKQIREKEKELFINFINGDGSRVAAIIDEHQGHKLSQPTSDVFWWLSVMQHYGHPTRLIDFTKDIRIALFFAIQHLYDERKQKRPDKDLVIYCFPCMDLKYPTDPNNNKSPISFNKYGVADMNHAVGKQIGLPGFEGKCVGETKQKFGWDRPDYQNARLKFQKGMFVYPYEYLKELKNDDHSWLVQNLQVGSGFNLGTTDDVPPKRIRIPFKYAVDLKKALETRYFLTPATVYVDYARVNIDASPGCKDACQPVESR